jgi:hypothetical protein
LQRVASVSCGISPWWASITASGISKWVGKSPVPIIRWCCMFRAGTLRSLHTRSRGCTPDLHRQLRQHRQSSRMITDDQGTEYLARPSMSLSATASTASHAPYKSRTIPPPATTSNSWQRRARTCLTYPMLSREWIAPFLAFWPR